MSGAKKSKKKDFTWRITKDTEGKVALEFGPSLSDAPFDTDTKLKVLGKSLVNLGMQLMESTTEDDEDWDEDDE